MKKWQTAMVAVSPILLLFIVMRVIPLIDNYMDEKYLNSALNHFDALEDFDYTLTFDLDLGNDDEPLIIRDEVIINTLESELLREHHIIDVTPKVRPESTGTFEYITDQALFEGILFNPDRMPVWLELPEESWFSMYLNLMTPLKDSLRYNKDSAVLIIEGENSLTYRLYQDDLENEAWFKSLEDIEQESLLEYWRFRAQSYHIDIEVDKGSKTVVAIKFNQSAIGDYITIISDFVPYYGKKEPQLDINYLITNIRESDWEIEIPEYEVFTGFDE